MTLRLTTLNYALSPFLQAMTLRLTTLNYALSPFSREAEAHCDKGETNCHIPVT
jgi:hypothetical protein